MELSVEKSGQPRRSLPDGLSFDHVRRYIDRRDPDMQAIEDAIAAGDAKTLREITHKLKGNAALYGLGDFGMAAARVLAAVEAKDWMAVDSGFREMQSLLGRAKRELMARPEIGSVVPPPPPSPAL